MAARSDSEEGLPPTDVHDVLRNERRRLVLRRLLDRGEPTSVRALAEHVASVEAEEDPPSQGLRQSAYVSLHQTHLPKLDALGVVDYDDEAKTVALAERAEDVTVYLEVVPRYGLSQNELFFCVALLGGLLALASAVGVPVLVAVAPGDWAVVSLVAIAVTAGYCTWQQGGTVLDRL